MYCLNDFQVNVTWFYNHHHHLSEELLIFPSETLSALNTNSPFLLPKPLVTNILISVCMCLTTLGTLYKWNLSIFVLCV